ncbi:hypothetical protein [Vibrio variabilis]|uniref:hypothetical protein n=1 Tax=Vibrio variabilis TaxID=990271 RepID=UPI000DD96113|nr:hypothetical protein [Vibrio variabilis]
MERASINFEYGALGCQHQRKSLELPLSIAIFGNKLVEGSLLLHLGASTASALERFFKNLVPKVGCIARKKLTNCSSRQLTVGDFGLVEFSDYVALLECLGS